LTRVPVGVLVSGSGTNLQALIDACAEPSFPAQITVVISNRPGVRALDRARDAGIPAMVLPHRSFASRESYDDALVATLREYSVVWVAMAGFLRVVTSRLLGAFPDHVLNIHPALLPAFPGMDGQGQALAAGVCLAGATVHLVTEGVDAGPILAQGAVGVRQDDDPGTLRDRILDIEHTLYPRVLRWAAEGRIHLVDGRARVDLRPGESRSLLVP
jgi:phosphoribosylglycinamide formyltransferase-1